MEIQEKVKQAVMDFTDEYGYPPTIREIADLVFRSPSVIHRCVGDLLAAGELESDHCGSPRALRIPGQLKNQISRKDVIELISNMAGCDGADEYAVVWDNTCRSIIRAIEEM